MYHVREISLPIQDITLFSLSHIAYPSSKHLGMTLIIFMSSYTLQYHYQCNNQNSYIQVETIIHRHLRQHILAHSHRLT